MSHAPLVGDPLAIAEELARLNWAERVLAFSDLPKDQQIEVFQRLDTAHQRELLEELGEDDVRPLLEALEPDDRTRLLDQVSDEAALRILAELSPRERKLTEALLEHEPESAGRIMTPELVALQAGMTITEAMAAIRRQGGTAETIYTLPVTDERRRLIGMVELSDLVLASPDARVVDLMDPTVRFVRVDDDQEEVARLMQASDLLAVPVIDAEDRLVGLITIDDAMDVMTEELSEDLARTGAAEPLGQPYFSVSIFLLARSRATWLLVLVVAATLTVNVLSAFEATLEEAVSLALFIPLLIGTGGNAGAQSATTIIRAMAVDEIRFAHLLRVVLRETATGALLGLMLGGLGVAPVWLLFGRELAVVISISLVTICTLASLVGSTMPMIADRIGVDPAIVSAPFVTTIVDATGLLVYFLIARAVLGI